MIQRIYSKALCLKESEYKSLSNKIIKILEIMRASDEFYWKKQMGYYWHACGSGKNETVPLLKKILRKKEKSPI